MRQNVRMVEITASTKEKINKAYQPYSNTLHRRAFVSLLIQKGIEHISELDIVRIGGGL